jgi:cytochrome c-type biogenesis protein CcmE
MMLRNKKFLISGLLILVAVSFLAYTGFESSAIYYYTVSELTVQDESVRNTNIRVNGQVDANSVEHHSTSSSALEFTITEGGESLPVFYQGIVPDTFGAGREIVIEGHLDSEGVFQADSILTKCPSKYEPEG